MTSQTTHVPPHPKRLRILMVSTSYPSDLSDWRGLFIRHLVEALSRRTDIDLRLWAPPGNCLRPRHAWQLPRNVVGWRT